MTNTRKMVTIAILSALSFVLMFFSFPIIPAASFLQIDFSVIPMMMALVMFDLKSSFAVLMLRSVLKLFLDNNGPSTYIGLPMNIVALGLFLAAFAIIWNRRKTIATYIYASIVGSIALTLGMLVLNYFFAIPLYAKFANFDIGALIGVKTYLVSMVIPFNMIEGIILAGAFYLIYVACKPVIERYQYS